MELKLLSNKWLVVILCAVSFFIYANAIFNDFVWDDEEQVVKNTVIREWKNLPLILTSSTFYAGGAGLSGGFYRPLVSLSYLLNYKIWGLNPAGFRFFQLSLHLVNIILIFLLVNLILERQKIKHGRAIAFFSALIFAVHPVNVESVVYIGSIGEIIYSFCLLLGLISFIKSFNQESRLVSYKYYIGCFVLVLLGLLAKETAIMALPLLLLYQIIFLRPARGIYFKFFFAASITISFYAFLRLAVAKIGAIPQHYAPIYFAPLWQRLLTVPSEVVSYLGIIFFPKDLSISRHFVITSASDIRFWGSLIILAILVALVAVYLCKTKSKVFAFFILWFLGALAPTLNVIPLDMTMAERWLYIPLIGMIAAVALVVLSMIFDLAPKNKKIVFALLLAMIFALSIRTIARNEDWKSGLALYTHDIALAPKISPQGSFDLENNVGVELFRVGRVDEAGEHFKKSISLQPKWSSPQNNLGAVLEQLGDLEGALAQYRKSAEISDYYLAHENIAGILMKMKRYDDARKALENSLTKFPDNNNLKLRLAVLFADDNALKDPEGKQKAINLLGQILTTDSQNQQAWQLYYIIENKQKFEI